jgi:hypothetical protein
MDYEAEKQKMIDEIHKAYNLLFSNLEKIPQERWIEPVLNKWSIKDLLAHIHAWHRKMKQWYEIGKEGGTPETPAPGYKWNQMKEVNELVYQEYKDHSLEVVMDLLEKSHQELLILVEQEPAKHFFERGAYPWLGNSYLKSYIKPNTSGHYNWAKKHIRKWMKTQGL